MKIRPTSMVATIAIAAGLSTTAVLAQGRGSGKGSGAMQQRRAQMAEMHQKMESEMQKQDAELDKLVSEMNTAMGDKKVDAIAAVVNKLVEQRKAMHQQMAEMHEKRGAGRRMMMMENASPAASVSASPATRATVTPTPAR
jgi:hypothetical protein